MGKLTESQRDEAIRMYRSGSSAKRVGEAFDVSPVAILQLLRKRGITRRQDHRKTKLTTDKEWELCNRYAAGEPAKLLAPEYGVSVSLVSRILRRQRFQPRNMSEIHRRFECNHGFFDRIDTEEKAYWMGFISADGAIIHFQRKANPQIAVSVALSDAEHLYRLQQSLGSNHPVHTYDYTESQGKGKNKPFAKLVITSEHLAMGLARHGIVPAKTHLIEWPTLPPDLLAHFTRGYMDGDGGFYIVSPYGKTKSLQLTFRVTSNIVFLKGCQSFLMQACGLKQTKISLYKNSEGIGTLVYNGRQQASRIFHLLYDDAMLFLPRKRDKVIQYVA